MRLKHITFTGIDVKTDVRSLREIQKEFPLAEFGVLASYTWYENGNRFLAPSGIDGLRSASRQTPLNLSLHLCGKAAHDAATGGWNDINELTIDNLHIFKRVQLNLVGRQDNPEYCWIPQVIGQELIIQQKALHEPTLYQSTVKHWSDKPFPHRDTISVLFDPSGGRGIESPLKVYPSAEKTGYAGGIGPDNVADKLSFLLSNHTTGDFWIDMESGVRTNDWFDLNKVHAVLRACREVIKEYHPF